MASSTSTSGLNRYFALLSPVIIALVIGTYYTGANVYIEGNMAATGFAGTASPKSVVFLTFSIFFFPASLIFSLLYTFFLVKLTTPTEVTKTFFLSCLTLLLLVVLILSAKAPIFTSCGGILSCTFASPGLNGKTFGGHDDYADDYNMPASYSNSFALIYFFTALFAFPFLVWQLYLSITDLLFKPASAYAASASSSSSPYVTMEDEVPSPLVNADTSVVSTADVRRDSKAAEISPVAPVVTANFVHELLQKQKRTIRILAVCLGLLVLLPVHIIITTRLGNNFQWIFPFIVAKWAAREIVPENNIGEVYQYRISSDLVLKLFPDVLMFFTYIYVNVFFALCGQLLPPVKKIFSSRPFSWLPLLNAPLGEILFWLLLVSYGTSNFCYWYLVHGWEGNPIEAVTQAERFSRTIAQVALSLMGLMILPVSRNSLWSVVFGISWEEMIKFHRIVARGFLLCCLLHMFSFWYAFSERGVFPQAMFDAPNSWILDNETIPMMSFLFMCLVLPIMGVLTLDLFRRKYFEVFYFSHFLSMVFFLATLWHAASAWYFLLPGLALWMIDHALRFTKSCQRTQLEVLIPHSAKSVGITELRFSLLGHGTNASASSLKFEAGQYLFLNVPSIAMLEFHPFTISSSPFDQFTSCHIKAMDKGSFTEKLYELAVKANNFSSIVSIIVNVDGPYGMPFDFNKHSHVLLLGGGIGITPLHSILRTILLLRDSNQLGDACALQKVTLMWAVPNPDLTSIFEHTFAKIQDETSKGKSQLVLEVKVYCSAIGDVADERENGVARQNIIKGRPPIQAAIDELKACPMPLVFVCGPPPMVDQAKDCATKASVPFHSETFLL